MNKDIKIPCNKNEFKKFLCERLISETSLRSCIYEEDKAGDKMFKEEKIFKNVEAFLDDIDDMIRDLVNQYLKTVMINAKITYFRKINKPKKYGIVFYNYEDFSEEISYDDAAFSELLEDNLEYRFIVCNEEFVTRNRDLVDALHKLSEIQRDVILQIYVANRTQREIAKEYGVSFQMISKHKIKALRKLKEVMKIEPE